MFNKQLHLLAVFAKANIAFTIADIYDKRFKKQTDWEPEPYLEITNHLQQCYFSINILLI